MQGTIGEVRMWAGTWAPEYWFFCNGQPLQIAQYQALYSIIGNTYGGNNQSTFNLPDFRGRAPVHAGQGTGLTNHTIGQQIGTETVALNATQMPTHTHVINASSANGSVAPAGGNLIASSAGTELNFAPGTVTPNVTLASSTVGSTGNSAPHANIQPSLVLNFVICAVGDYPVRP